MAQNTMAEKAPKANPVGTFTMRIGNTTYVIGVHFSQTSKETMDDKVLRLIKNDIRNAAMCG